MWLPRAAAAAAAKPLPKLWSPRVRPRAAAAAAAAAAGTGAAGPRPPVAVVPWRGERWCRGRRSDLSLSLAPAVWTRIAERRRGEGWGNEPSALT